MIKPIVNNIIMKYKHKLFSGKIINSMSSALQSFLAILLEPVVMSIQSYLNCSVCKADNKIANLPVNIYYKYKSLNKQDRGS